MIFIAGHRLVKSGYECRSSDTSLSLLASTEEDCATKCKEKEGCNYFAFGKLLFTTQCQWEKTTDSSCPEGWKRSSRLDFYELYEIQGKL